MLASSGGNVGIGTTNPGARFAVNGSSIFGDLSTNYLNGGSNTAIFGYANSTGASQAFVTGSSSAANGTNSFSSGYLNTVAGVAGAAIGEGLYSGSRGQIVFGTYNVNTAGATSTIVSTDQLFVIGNGPNIGNRTNAMTVLKNGNIGIGTTSPTYALSVSGDVNVTGNFRVNGTVLTAGGGSNLTGVTNISNASGDITLAPAAGSGSTRISSGVASTSSTSGSLIVTGGVGVSGAIYSGGAISSGSTVSAATSMYTPQLYGTSTPSGNISIDGTSAVNKGNVLLASAGGKVGIGTTTAPTATLTIANTGAAYTLDVGGVSRYNGRLEVNDYVAVDSRYDGNETLAFSAGNYSPSNGTGSYIQFESYNAGYNALVESVMLHGVMTSGANGNEFGDFYVSTLGSGTTTEKFRIKGSGQVGVGTSTPTSKLHVIGDITSEANVIASGAAVNLSLSNTHVLQSVGGSTITLSNMANGGTYTLILQDQTSRTYSFAGCANTKFSPASSATTAATDTIFGLTTVKVGGAWYCYVTWSSGFQ